MRDPTLFSDEIVQITEFKKNAKSYADRARRRPLTIAQGGVADLALMRREILASALARHEHFANALDILMHAAQGTPLRLLTWAEDLDEDDRAAFTAEYVSSVQRADALGTSAAWRAVEELLEDWTATAEAAQNEELVEALAERDRVNRPS